MNRGRGALLKFGTFVTVMVLLTACLFAVFGERNEVALALQPVAQDDPVVLYVVDDQDGRRHFSSLSRRRWGEGI